MESRGQDAATVAADRLKRAINRGWAVPLNDALPQECWVEYWRACEAYEAAQGTDACVGRPVVPHRSGGAQGVSHG